MNLSDITANLPVWPTNTMVSSQSFVHSAIGLNHLPYHVTASSRTSFTTNRCWTRIPLLSS